MYEALAFSICLHAAAGLAAIASNLWRVAFPTNAPALDIAFAIETPIPPPPPPPPARPKAPEQNNLKTTIAKIPENLFVAPTVIPDAIPIVRAQELTPAPTAIPNGLLEGIEAGILNGVAGGIAGGMEGGVVGGTPDSVAVAEDGRVHIARDKKLPMTPVSQDYPTYPSSAQRRGWEDELVVQYVIGKDGRVRDVTVIVAPAHDVFVDETLRAIRTWRFRPMIRNGEAHEVVHQLTVFFRLYSTAT